MPVPATLTSYLPALLHSVAGQPPPDDSSFSAQPDGQVDYLSHEWREEDVWRSWRSMTRQKNAIANGMRLENASWRTWWKQRNNLPTVSPETLNWLKDSDVTWLYGPLHIGCDWSKTTHQEPSSKPSIRRQNSAESVSSTKLTGKKPILKHRSISELLSLPQSPFFAQDGSDEEGDEDATHVGGMESPSRPPLMHTKSDTHISWRSRPFRKNSPPRIIAPESPVDAKVPSTSTTTATSSDISNSTSSSQDFNTASSSGADGPGGKKKHISFNTFVEQYISIEKPKSKHRGSIHFYTDPVYEDGYEEDSEGGDGEELDDPAAFYVEESSGMVTDSDDEDEDDVLEMRSSRSRSSSTSSRSGPPTMRTTSPLSSSASRRPPIVRQSSTDRERVTIAPIAPTLLKATSVGNHLRSIGEEELVPQKELELVYLPPSNSIYSLPGTPSLGSEDVYHHRESYFSVGTDRPLVHARSADPSPALALPRGPSSHSNLQQFFGPQPTLYSSPEHADDIREEDPYDYFGAAADFGDEYTMRRHNPRVRRDTPDVRSDDHHGDGVMRYAQGGAASVSVGRSSGDRWASPISASPQIVVNEVAGAEEEREELSTGSSSPPRETALAREVVLPPKTDTRKEDDIPLAVSFIRPGGAVPVPVPRIATHASSTSPPDGSFLSPSEAVVVVGRGRSPGCSPVSGSTTTGSYSYSSDSRSESRGRSSTRNSSFSDRDSSRGTNSPLGSISPTGSAIAMGAGRGRDSRTGAKMFRRDDERGRDRTGRKIGDSLSPPNVMSSPSRSISDDFPPYSPVLDDSVLSASTASVSSSSVSGSSTASADTAATVAPPSRAEPHEEPPRRVRASQVPLPSPIPEEEETRSRQPTPANSPVRALASPTHTPPTPHAPAPKSRPSAPATSPSEAKATPHSPPPPSSRVPPEQQHGTLVGRAAEIVSSARGLLGAIWNAV